MHVDWSGLGLWFLASLCVFGVGFGLSSLNDGRIGGSFIDIPVLAASLFTLGTGIVRSVSPFSLPMCWLAGVLLVVPLYCLILSPYILYMLLSTFFQGGKERR